MRNVIRGGLRWSDFLYVKLWVDVVFDEIIEWNL